MAPGGTLYVCFSNHIPGLESADLRFFELLAPMGFAEVSRTSFQAAHMWSDAIKEVLLVELQLLKMK
jgi:hypothetical protein